jgi:predicted RNase H-like nuclease (RuvC/YqgF family)
VGKVRERARERGRRLVRAAAPTLLSSVEEMPAMRDRVGQLERALAELRERTEGYRRRIETLEAESHDARQLQLRVAELTDIVQELLLPAADRDEHRLAELRQKYASSL